MNIEWYCCNRCFLKLINAEEPFSLTQCGHMFCAKCISGVKKGCPQCKTTDVASMTLNLPLEPRLSVFFTSYETMLDNLQKAVRFQNMQMAIVMQKYMSTVEKYSAMKKEYWMLMQKVEHLKKKIKTMELEAKMEAKQKELDQRQKHNVISPFFIRNDSNKNYRDSETNLNSTTSILRNRMSNVHFSPDINIFRVPSCVNIPRTSRKGSAGSTGSQRRTPFSEYSPSCSS